jgi:hypothetical protein
VAPDTAAGARAASAATGHRRADIRTPISGARLTAYCAAVLHGKHHPAKGTKTPGHAGDSAKASKPTHGSAKAHPSHSPKATKTPKPTKTTGATAKKANAVATGHPSGTG